MTEPVEVDVPVLSSNDTRKDHTGSNAYEQIDPAKKAGNEYSELKRISENQQVTDYENTKINSPLTRFRISRNHERDENHLTEEALETLRDGNPLTEKKLEILRETLKEKALALKRLHIILVVLGALLISILLALGVTLNMAVSRIRTLEKLPDENTINSMDARIKSLEAKVNTSYQTRLEEIDTKLNSIQAMDTRIMKLEEDVRTIQQKS